MASARGDTGSARCDLEASQPHSSCEGEHAAVYADDAELAVAPDAAQQVFAGHPAGSRRAGEPDCSAALERVYDQGARDQRSVARRHVLYSKQRYWRLRRREREANTTLMV